MRARVIDNFLPNAAAIRAHALSSAFIDWEGHDGETYKRVCLTEVPGLLARLEEVIGPVDMLGMGYRLNFDGELPNAAIHSDVGWGTHALVLYLSEGEGGTAFWRHKTTGAHRFESGDVDLFERIRYDWDDASRWEMTDLAEMKLGRAVIYESALFHSRWPFAAFGKDADSGRLIAVAFFTPKEGQCTSDTQPWKTSPPSWICPPSSMRRPPMHSGPSSTPRPSTTWPPT